MSPDITALEEQLDAAQRDAEALVTGLDPRDGAWQPDAGSWSIAQCLDHLATANRVYLGAMAEPARRAREAGRRRRGPAVPGVFGRWFVRSLEPPVHPRLKGRAPKNIQPRPAQALALADAYASFRAAQNDVRAFLRAHADLDLAGVRFPNPLVRGVRFSLATGLHAIAAHERRHLWQAWDVRRRLERAAA